MHSGVSDVLFGASEEERERTTLRALEQCLSLCQNGSQSSFKTDFFSPPCLEEVVGFGDSSLRFGGLSAAKLWVMAVLLLHEGLVPMTNSATVCDSKHNGHIYSGAWHCWHFKRLSI